MTRPCDELVVVLEEDRPLRCIKFRCRIGWGNGVITLPLGLRNIYLDSLCWCHCRAIRETRARTICAPGRLSQVEIGSFIMDGGKAVNARR